MTGTGGLDTMRQRLLGGWQLAHWHIRYSDGRAPSYPFGPQATGLILYTADGYMSACIAAAGRTPLSSASVRSAPTQEQVEAFGSYFQYGGRFEVVAHAPSPSGWQVHHHVSHALNPNFVGTTQARNMVFEGDTQLTLSATDRMPGSQVERLHELVWKRGT